MTDRPKIAGQWRRLTPAALCTLAAWLLAGCVVGPRYSRPSAPLPGAYKETPDHWKQAEPADQVLRGKWWEIYQNPELNRLRREDQRLQSDDQGF